MSLKIEALSAVAEKGKLNEEWMVVANEGDRAFNLTGCSITVSRGARTNARVAATLKAGLVIQPKERCRLVTGSSGKRSHGETVEQEGIRNFHLFLKAAYLDKTPVTVKLMNRQHELCRAVFDPKGLSKDNSVK